MSKSLIATMSDAITKSLLANLPSALAEKFELDNDEITTFLNTWLADQLKNKKTKKAADDKKVKKTNAFMMYTATRRDALRKKNPKATLGDISKLVGEEWNKLSDKKKAEWKSKAVEENERREAEGGSVDATTKKGGKAASKKNSGGKKQTTEIKLTRIKELKLKCWVIEGTPFIVQSQKDHTVIGKVKGTGDKAKAIKLSEADITKCEDNGWNVKGAEQKSKSKKKDEDDEGEDGDENEGGDEEEEGGDEEEEEGGDEDEEEGEDEDEE